MKSTDRIRIELPCYPYFDGVWIEGTVVGEAGVTGKAESDGLKGSSKRLAGFGPRATLTTAVPVIGSRNILTLKTIKGSHLFSMDTYQSCALAGMLLSV